MPEEMVCAENDAPLAACAFQRDYQRDISGDSAASDARRLLCLVVGVDCSVVQANDAFADVFVLSLSPHYA